MPNNSTSEIPSIPAAKAEPASLALVVAKLRTAVQVLSGQ